MLAFPNLQWTLASSLAGGRRTGAHLIVDRLYLGDWSTAGNKDKLNELGITHVVSVLDIPPEIPNIIEKDNLLHIQVDDTINANILRHFERTTEFIKSALEKDDNNKVLVHCLMGISRSATVVAAYLVATHNMAGSEAIAFVQTKRPVVCPNFGFREQLDMYAAKYGPNAPFAP